MNMSSDEQKIVDLVRAGNVDLSELKEMFSEASLASNVSVSDWGACYSSATGQLSQFATVSATNSGDTITGVGMITYTSNGSTMLCLQYTNGFSNQWVATSVGTNLYTPPGGSSVLCIVYGWTQNSGSFYVSNILPVGAC
jgi:hypothetical protein